MKSYQTRSRPRTRLFKHGLFVAVALTLVLPALPYAWLALNTEPVHGYEFTDANPRANFWRKVREGDRGYTAVPGNETGVLIYGNGQNWRQLRMQILAPYGSYLMTGVLVVILIFWAAKGRIGLTQGRSGRRVARFSVNQRVAHWLTVTLFWILAFTGLVLLYGRFILIPLFGPNSFAIVASACKEAHNLFGPLFLLALVILFINFVKGNMLAKEDLSWLRRGGGFFGKHVHAGCFNFGEKMWFWLVCILGLTVSVTGLILDFPVLGTERFSIGLAHVIHAAAALIIISVAFGHIYLAAIGTEGTLEGMTSGSVDANWAAEHHDRWKPDEVTADVRTAEPPGSPVRSTS